MTPAAWESQTDQGQVKLAQQGGEEGWENREGRKEESKWRRGGEQKGSENTGERGEKS